MATITVTGTISDGQGSAPFSVIVQTDAVNITAATVTPAVAVSGTTRTLTIAATSSANLPLAATIASLSGITFTPVTGQPAGTFKWTFIY